MIAMFLGHYLNRSRFSNQDTVFKADLPIIIAEKLLCFDFHLWIESTFTPTKALRLITIDYLAIEPFFRIIPNNGCTDSQIIQKRQVFIVNIEIENDCIYTIP